jgi:hypothetical protein
MICTTARKLAFSNQFRDRKIPITIETNLETDILKVNFKKKLVVELVAHVL